ncbi:hypothetical protein LJB95_01030 [Paludibacteraceae bacterium OttesenSCG-928-F17]|nr:hypothetical protein [Paludibacteraceae bacterium OttesenSCG-928-F17]
MSRIYHFADGLPTEGDNIQTANLAFGNIENNVFRITSSFNMNGNRARAITDGTILLFAQLMVEGAETKVNLILKPHANLKMPVKYFIYRGLSASSFIDEDANIQKNENGSEFIKKINRIQKDRTNDINVRIPIETLFHYNPNDLQDQNNPYNTRNNPNLDVVDLCFHNKSNDDYQLCNVTGNMELGNFATGEGGLDIVLENNDMIIDMDMAMASALYISGESAWKKERIRHFVDPAAFFAIHYDFFRNDSNKKLNINQAYESILQPYQTKNKIYLDIRNENGYSYNYYGNYSDNDNNDDNDIQINDGVQNIEVKYGYGWPIHIIDGNNFPNESSSISIKLKKDRASTPHAVVGRYAKVKSKAKELENLFYINELEKYTTDNFTDPIEINIKKSTLPIVTLIRLDYIRKNTGNSSDELFYSANPLNFLFGPAINNNAWAEQGAAQLKWQRTLDRYLSIGDSTWIMTSGIIKENTENSTKYLYYADPTILFGKNKGINQGNKFNNLIAGTSLQSSFLEMFNSGNNKNNIINRNVTISEDNKNLFSYENMSEDENIIEKNETFFLGISHNERERLLNGTRPFTNQHEKLFSIKKAAEEGEEEDHCYTLSLAGFDNESKYNTSAESIPVYSVDGRMFFSDEYLGSTAPFREPSYRIKFKLKEDYYEPSDLNNNFGFDWLRKEYYTGNKALCIGSNKPGVSSKEDAQRELKKEYELIQIGGKDYYVPWLTLINYPENTDFNSEDSVRYKATLRLEIEDSNLSSLNGEQLKFNPDAGVHVRIITSNGSIIENQNELIITLDTIANLTNTTIEFFCNASNINRSVSITAGTNGNRRLVGKLNIYRNTISNKSLKFIKVNFNGTLDGIQERGEPVEYNINFITNARDGKNIRLTKQNGTSSPQGYKDNHTRVGSKTWEEYLSDNRTRKFTKNILQQYLINYNYDPEIAFSYDAEINITFNNQAAFTGTFREGNNQPGGINFSEKDVLNIINTIYTNGNIIPKYDSGEMIPVISFTESGIKAIMNTLTNCLPDGFNNNAICIFTLPISFVQSSTNEYMNAYDYNKSLFLIGYPKKVTKDTLSHEILHSLGLSHPFAENPEDTFYHNKKFIFEMYETDNIMDYAKNYSEKKIKTTSWKWQVKKVNENTLNDDISFPPTNLG